MLWLLTVYLVLQLVSWPVGNAEISSGRIKGDDEPHMVSWRVLEGVTEPFESNLQESIPAWKQMKNGADQKAAGLFIQQALHEYGQLLRHPYMFGEMPMEDRYDVFLSMSKLLKTMGFHQRAELLLYEAMSYTTNPHEAHLQLGLLFLDKEDLEKAKIHLKNCLFFKENDVHILIHLSVILIAEGRMHEAKFFLSRILSGLEARVHTLSFMLSPKDIHSLTTDRVEYKTLSTWVEDLIVKVFYGEFRFTPSATMDMLKLFSNLYRWISEGELVGRFIFDLGQSLYEGGRPRIGQMMMKRGFETSDAEVEGAVSTAIVDMRLALDYPVVPDTQVEILEAYVNMTSYLSTTSSTYVAIDVENVVDLYWPLPLLPWSALPMMPVVKEVLWRFEGGPVRSDVHSLYWYNETTYDEIIELYHPGREVVSSGRYLLSAGKGSVGSSTSSGTGISTSDATTGIDKEKHVLRFDVLQPKHKTTTNGIQTIVIPPTSPTPTTTTTTTNKRTKPTTTSTSLTPSKIKVEVGIFGGHMNNHPVGHMVFRRILALLQPPITHTSTSTSSAIDWRDVINLTLLALPLVPDTTTKRIANSVTRIVNLPMDTNQAWRIIQQLHLDVLFFPDWQPFPDQQSTLFMSRRMAPVQVCFYVRGSSCSSVAVDYYVLPIEMEEMYYKSTPAAAVDAKVTVSTSVSSGTSSTSTSTSSGSVRPSIPQEGSFDPSTSTSTTANPTSTTTTTNNATKHRLVQRSLRPQWREFYSEQVVLLDWPVMTTRVIQAVASSVASSISSTSGSGGSSANTGNSGSGGSNSDNTHTNTLDTLMFAPLETEGRIFFENQPVAVLPIHPAYLHPLMDDVLFKIMRSVPSLHVVIALPDMFFTHVRDSKHKISWARKLVRRLWARGGSLFHRIRLLPSPLSDHRMLQLLRQADMVLDSFPIGSPFHLLSLATSVGTPVVTLRPGTSFSTSKDTLREMRTYITTHRAKHRALSNTSNNTNTNNNTNNSTNNTNHTSINAHTNPMAQHVMMFDLPYMPASSSICGYYDRIGLGAYFVANSTSAYFELAESLATNREFAYSLRVRLLEAVDDQKHHHHSASPNTASASATTDSTSTNKSPSSGVGVGGGNTVSAGSTMDEWEESDQEGGVTDNTTTGADSDSSFNGAASTSSGDVVEGSDDCGHCVDDLGRFILSVGVPYARSRSWRAQSILQQRGTSGTTASAGGSVKTGGAGTVSRASGTSSGAKSRKARRSAAAAARSEVEDANDEFYGAGTIA